MVILPRRGRHVPDSAAFSKRCQEIATPAEPKACCPPNLTGPALKGLIPAHAPQHLTAPQIPAGPAGPLGLPHGLPKGPCLLRALRFLYHTWNDGYTPVSSSSPQSGWFRPQEENLKMGQQGRDRVATVTCPPQGSPKSHLKPRNSIHPWHMKSSILVIILRKAQNVPKVCGRSGGGGFAGASWRLRVSHSPEKAGAPVTSSTSYVPSYTCRKHKRLMGQGDQFPHLLECSRPFSEVRGPRQSPFLGGWL